jgi:hypothetical protein
VSTKVSSNGEVIRISRKGLKKFAFGEEGEPFEVDVITTFQKWISIDNDFRDDGGLVPPQEVAAYHQAAVDFACQACNASSNPAVGFITTAEALDFIARLREQWEDLTTFFRSKSREERGLPGTSGTEDVSRTEHRFSTEPD